MANQNELTKSIINPNLLLLIKQSQWQTTFSNSFSFDFDRMGREFYLIIYIPKEQNGASEINISTRNTGIRNSIIIQDYCKSPEDLKNVFEKLDDLITRMPVVKK